jgi:hypothetical protein
MKLFSNPMATPIARHPSSPATVDPSAPWTSQNDPTQAATLMVYPTEMSNCPASSAN